MTQGCAPSPFPSFQPDDPAADSVAERHSGEAASGELRRRDRRPARASVQRSQKDAPTGVAADRPTPVRVEEEDVVQIGGRARFLGNPGPPAVGRVGDEPAVADCPAVQHVDEVERHERPRAARILPRPRPAAVGGVVDARGRGCGVGYPSRDPPVVGAREVDVVGASGEVGRGLRLPRPTGTAVASACDAAAGTYRDRAAGERHDAGQGPPSSGLDRPGGAAVRSRPDSPAVADQPAVLKVGERDVAEPL